MVVLGVIGNPVKHSLSPLIHSAWLKENAIDGQYNLVCIENQEKLEEEFLKLQSDGYLGVNVTLPYKTEIFKIAQKHGFEILGDALEIGAVNTVNFAKKQALNTDVYGIKQMLKIKEDCQVLVVGAGGASFAVVKGLEGANVTITNRTPEKAQFLAEKFWCDCFTGNLQKLDLSNFDLIINTTSLGLNGEDLQLNYKSLKKHTKCVDIIYNPKMTPFLTQGKAKGCEIANGSMMLIYQAQKAFESWFNVKPKIETARKVMREFIL
jgi:shikimate dehydrogenase